MAAKKNRTARKNVRRKAGERAPHPGKDARAPRAPVHPDLARSIAAPRSGSFFVVGIGASAGGLEALESFFNAMPGDSGMAFVVITHQSAMHESLLPQLLAKRTTMPVETARDRMQLERNHVYLSPPGKNLALLQGEFHVMEVLPKPNVHLPIDYFFRSLAHDQADRAICIVLSGTGTDGTLGLRAIKGDSGMAIVQDTNSAQYSGMPDSATSTLLVDFVLPPDRMPAQLLAYAGAAGTALQSSDALESELHRTLPKIFVLLRDRTGHDFSGYKQQTMERRIERRVRVHQMTRATDYLHLLQTEPHELELLFQELLINVTQFFRDPPAFDALAKVLSELIESKSEPALRIWVPGCSTGEEAYSIAMLAVELAERAGKRLQLQVFGTDLDPRAIDVARRGFYPEGIVADVDEQRLKRFFVAEPLGFRIHKHVRDHVMFATHNVLSDPPFIKLDLLSCRNLLIYLVAPLQQRLFMLFHYALKRGGKLFLGTSETVPASPELFEVLDRRWKIYIRRDTVAGRLPATEFGLRSAGFRAPGDGSVRTPSGAGALVGIAQNVEALLIRRFAPATLIVSARGEIAYIHGRMGTFLEPATGEPSNNLFSMAREGLRLCLQSAIRAAAIEAREVVHRGIPVHTRTGFESVTVRVRRIDDPEPLRGLFRVSFSLARLPEKSKPKLADGERASSPARERASNRTGLSLEDTLKALQTSNDELTSTNEELQSTNQELQSANEELETSKEELNSLNEELQTLNAELQLKIDELAQVNDDMQNLLNGTDIATLFLDRELRVKRFTEQARRVVRLIATDIGRPIADLVSQVRYDSLAEDAKRVLATLTPHETEAQTLDGRWLLVRVLPYRTAQNVIDGVVIVFIDIDRLKRAEVLAAASAFAESIVQAVDEPLVVLDRDLRVISTNRAFSRVLELQLNEIQGHRLFELSPRLSSASGLREQLEAVWEHGTAIEAFEFSFGPDPTESSAQIMRAKARRLEGVSGNAARLLLVLTGPTARIA